MNAPMGKGPYGIFTKTEKKCHKNMALRKEKITYDCTKQRAVILLLGL